MTMEKNSKLITKVILIGLVIGALSYLFHPEVGQLSVTVNGDPISDPFVRFAAFPTFLLILGLAAFLTILLFLGIGFFMFIGALFFSLAVCFFIAPYFWPILVIVFLIIALMSYRQDKPE